MNYRILLNSTFLLMAICLMAPWARSEAVTAFYKVPTKHPNLEAFSTFTLDNAQLSRTSNNLIEISYDLPETLVGAAIVHIDMTQSSPETANGFAIAGANGHGTCTRTKDVQITCQVAYLINAKYSVGTLFHLLSIGADHPFKRARISMEFGTDPIGTITIHLK